jgi:hypothetical protein
MLDLLVGVGGEKSSQIHRGTTNLTFHVKETIMGMILTFGEMRK